MKIFIKLIVLLNMFFFTSCKGQNEQLDCLNLSLQKDELTTVFNELKNGLNDTLNNWIYEKEYKNVQGFKTALWKIDDAIFISPLKNKAILLILEQDTVKFVTEPIGDGSPEKIVPTRFDYVKMIYANKEKDNWHYYYQSLPSMVVPRDKKINDIPIPLTFEELSLVGRRSVLKGYYKRGTCKYDDKFFERWDIKNLKEQHKKINGYY
jgi:hypothetical protein